MLPQNYEICDMYICLRGMCGENLIGRDHKGMELLTMLSQPMRKLDSGNSANQNICHVLCAVGAMTASKPQNFIG